FDTNVDISPISLTAAGKGSAAGGRTERCRPFRFVFACAWITRHCSEADCAPPGPNMFHWPLRD
ncbi:MAG: hypothetical protein AB7J63_04000, partial [Vicinamibacterales bacterium]